MLSPEEIQVLTIISQPEAGVSYFSSPLELIWVNLLAMAAMLMFYLDARVESFLNGLFMAGVGCGLFSFIFAFIVYNPLVWDLMLLLPEGPIWLKELSAVIVFGVLYVLLMFKAGSVFYGLGERGRLKQEALRIKSKIQKQTDEDEVCA